ncbi:MAG: class I SAM-dependent methyltransferase, partial [Patescibacteria group bacterium]
MNKIIIHIELPNDYETYSLLRKLVNLAFFWPFLYLVSYFSFIGKFLLSQKGSEDATILKENAGNHKAIEKIYLHNWRNYPTATQKIYNFFWGSFGNVMAARNRLKLVKKLTHHYILTRFLRRDRNKILELNILSVACGSARSVLETVSYLNLPGCKYNIVLVDDKKEALEYASNLATKLQIKDNITFTRKDVFEFQTSPETNFDVIEVVGLLEYLTKKDIVKLLQKLRSTLKPGGALITSNICPNVEQRFITNVIKWPL